MLPDYLIVFNEALTKFKKKYPQKGWTSEFQDSLINDYSFFSARIEDSKLEYGDAIRFFNNETIRSFNFNSLLAVSEHQTVLKSLIENLNDFKFSEGIIKTVHSTLMSLPFAWATTFKPELIGSYRNIPIIGSRQPSNCFWTGVIRLYAISKKYHFGYGRSQNVAGCFAMPIPFLCCICNITLQSLQEIPTLSITDYSLRGRYTVMPIHAFFVRSFVNKCIPVIFKFDDKLPCNSCQ